eukprot:c2833_g1_i2.p1 GENE.c2833_g1_i2~~c2833_g1_i2.p1  ORF type:complete len:392 (-),score=85.60 c2833_g1_i2:52-1227(-)
MPALPESVTPIPIPSRPSSSRVHAFYYPWYGNLEFDSKWLHWNHEYIPHWNNHIRSLFQSYQGNHKPPNDIASLYYPSLGPYSSADPSVLTNHMQQLQQAGVGVLVTSWFPVGVADAHGIPLDPLMPALLDTAHRFGIKIAFHMEPYERRSASSVANDIRYVVTHYATHPAVLRVCRYPNRVVESHELCQDKKEGKLLMYVYDSYQIPSRDWETVLKPSGRETIRETAHDAIVVGLWVEQSHGSELFNSGFDGVYTYFASPISYGSTAENWHSIASTCRKRQMLFIPCVGPGYVDTPVRPWNEAATVNRNDGDTFRKSFRNAIGVSPEMIAITSFNEWHEGTQIENSLTSDMLTEKGLVGYQSYHSSEDIYLQITRSLVAEFLSKIELSSK